MIRPMKDSGVEWIGTIPEQWGIIKFKYLVNSTNAGEVIDKNFWNSGNELLYTCQKTPMASDYEGFPEEKRTQSGDILLTRNATPYIFIPEVGAIYSNVVQRVKIKEGYSIKYIKYALLQGAESLMVNGNTIPSYNMEVWKNIYIPSISEETQDRIAEYLDCECTRIDSVIERTRSSIEEYRKLRQAVIVQAVTRGVHSNRSMKASGIEWVKELPEDWTITPAKYLFRNSDTRRLDGDEQMTASQQYGIISQERYMELTGAKVVFANKGLEDWKHVEPYDFIISLRSFQGGLEMSETTGCITWHYIVLKPCKEVYSYYYKWLFKSELYIKALQRTCNFIRDGQDLRYSNFVQVPLFEPSIKEQMEIAEYLNAKCSEIDNLIQQKEQLLVELERYKKSLIFEYVTGKKEVPV